MADRVRDRGGAPRRSSGRPCSPTARSGRGPDGESRVAAPVAGRLVRGGGGYPFVGTAGPRRRRARDALARRSAAAPIPSLASTSPSTQARLDLELAREELDAPRGAGRPRRRCPRGASRTRAAPGRTPRRGSPRARRRKARYEGAPSRRRRRRSSSAPPVTGRSRSSARRPATFVEEGSSSSTSSISIASGSRSRSPRPDVRPHRQRRRRLVHGRGLRRGRSRCRRDQRRARHRLRRRHRSPDADRAARLRARRTPAAGCASASSPRVHVLTGAPRKARRDPGERRSSTTAASRSPT